MRPVLFTLMVGAAATCFGETVSVRVGKSPNSNSVNSYSGPLHYVIVGNAAVTVNGRKVGSALGVADMFKGSALALQPLRFGNIIARKRNAFIRLYDGSRVHFESDLSGVRLWIWSDEPPWEH